MEFAMLHNPAEEQLLSQEEKEYIDSETVRVSGFVECFRSEVLHSTPSSSVVLLGKTLGKMSNNPSNRIVSFTFLFVESEGELKAVFIPLPDGKTYSISNNVAQASITMDAEAENPVPGLTNA